ncbi:KOW domain-containing RNA-binding protein [Bacillus sp. ISL-47]|uniref:KOW domain-containing RNA-binding protein n=1 Tax=Bacillus sp. ISL-47 TaxID=2819130 RepID=UPI001BE7F0B9|nr:KOW domain-containing RNA-binding protein [Bacillus sp. ISL-47]MBT2689943.1 KOW domain-containing RNA-binding protein [Bacillus sp. ISL-47]MBT2707682.1 KOW domain-containing RNA-binding protein [Pseudomonas sp. ISL-84]
MVDSDSNPQPGQIVLIKRGRDAGQYAIIIRLMDERFVLLADGDKKKFDHPKKKNIQHLQLLNYISPEVQSSLKETGRVTNGKLRFALAKYVNEFVYDMKKGESFNGERRCN